MRLSRITLRLSGAFFLAFSLTIGSAARAATCNVPSGSYAGIQDAINDGTCTTIVVAPGTYVETLNIDHSVTIEGDSSLPTIVDGNGTATVVDLSVGTTTLKHLTLTGGRQFNGGGVRVHGGAAVNLNYCTVTANEASGGGTAPAEGGGIFVESGTANLFNSTIAGNVARASLVGIFVDPGEGGGIYVVAEAGTLNVVSSTIADNLAEAGDTPADSGGIFGSATFSNTIIARNGGGNCGFTAPTDNGYNMSDDATCSFSGTGSQNSVPNLNLDTLKDNGGPTHTIALLTGSAALDQIAGGTNGCGTTVPDDQRGISRPQNGKCDIGAYERVCPPAPVITCPPDQLGVSNDSGKCSATLDPGTATSPDDCQGAVTVTGVRTDGLPLTDPYPVGVTFITWTATDPLSQKDVCLQKITVNDTEKPSLSCAGNQTASANASCQAYVPNFVTSATDNCPGLIVTQTPPVGTAVGLGVTNVTVTATDHAGNSVSCTPTFTVSDTTAPVVSSGEVIHILTSDHILKNVGFFYPPTVKDNCDKNPVVSYAIYSNEAELTKTAPGDGATSPDAKGLGTAYNYGTWYDKIYLRQERMNSGQGRVYLIVVTATDASNNKGYSCTYVISPKSSKRPDIQKAQAIGDNAIAPCNATGQIVPPFQQIGYGPIVGPKQ